METYLCSEFSASLSEEEEPEEQLRDRRNRFLLENGGRKKTIPQNYWRPSRYIRL